MPATPPERRTGPAATALRDYVLLGASIVLQFLAVRFHSVGFAWCGAALFWLAVLDSTRRQPATTRIVAAVASAFLLALAVMAVIAIFLVAQPPVAPVSPATLPALPRRSSSAAGARVPAMRMTDQCDSFSGLTTA